MSEIALEAWGEHEALLLQPPRPPPPPRSRLRPVATRLSSPSDRGTTGSRPSLPQLLAWKRLWQREKAGRASTS